MVADGAVTLPRPLVRDRLFIDLYESCRHRPTALEDASALTDLIIGRLLRQQRSRGLIERKTIVSTTQEVLKNFDAAAATFYAAYHPLGRPRT